MEDGSRHADLRSGDHVGWPTEKSGQTVGPKFGYGEWGCLESVY